jgi:hypothetical protein
MPNAYQVKGDLVNELRNKLYYNQLEIQRLLNNPESTSHREIVDVILDKLNDNVIAQSSLDLLEQYIPSIPAPQNTAPQQSGEQTSELKKIE